MLGALLTEQNNPEAALIDQLPTEGLLRIINNEDAKIAGAVAFQLPEIAKAVDAIVSAILKGGRLFYIGAGTSGRLGVLDASECPPTFNVPPDWVQGVIAGGESALSKATEASEDDPALGTRDLLVRGFGSGDVLAGIAASGRTPYVVGAVQEANRMGAVTVGITCVPDSDLARIAQISIAPAVGPEVIAGSTRLKAGTATKLVLNMLTTGTFIKLGYVYGNLMVNVEPKNEKLRDRALRIIMAAASVPRERAVELLRESGNRVQTAIVMTLSQVDRSAAELRLVQAKGNIRKAING